MPDATETSTSLGEASSPPAKPRKVRGTVYVKADRCKGCGFCIEFCPPKALAFSTDYNAHGYHTPVLAHPEKCTGCDLCGLYCPDFAIYGLILKGKLVPPSPVKPPILEQGEAAP